MDESDRAAIAKQTVEFGCGSKYDDVFDRVALRTLVGVTIAIACWVGRAAPAGADPDTLGTGADPFGGLSCSCPETAPIGGPAVMGEIDRGIREGLSASVPGLPKPAR
jgi:hypothetical protein